MTVGVVEVWAAGGLGDALSPGVARVGIHKDVGQDNRHQDEC